MLFVAEIGLNYDGNFDLAYELIRQAKRSGADVAKFQFGWKDKPGELNHIEPQQALKLKEWCDYHDIEMMVSVISENGYKLAQQIDFKRYKIASRTVIEHPELCQKVLAEGKETFVSLGWWKDDGLPLGEPSDKVRYIYCKSKYPTYPEHLGDVPQEYFDNPYYGYSDHYHGIAACILAISRGAQFIEKHFTLNKTSQVVHDHIGSATPEEFRQMVDLGSEVARLVQAVRKNQTINV